MMTRLEAEANPDGKSGRKILSQDGCLEFVDLSASAL
jgi:hypothetical protein